MYWMETLCLAAFLLCSPQVRLALEVMFEGMCGGAALGGVQGNGQPAGQGQVLRVGDAVTVTYVEGGGAAGAAGSSAAAAAGPHLVLEWQGGSEADMVADAVVAVVLQVGWHCWVVGTAHCRWVDIVGVCKAKTNELMPTGLGLQVGVAGVAVGFSACAVGYLRGLRLLPAPCRSRPPRGLPPCLKPGFCLRGMVPLLQASGAPPGLSAIEAERIKAIEAGDTEAAARAELGILTSLLSAQFGPARVDFDQVRMRGRGCPGGG